MSWIPFRSSALIVLLIIHIVPDEAVRLTSDEVDENEASIMQYQEVESYEAEIGGPPYERSVKRAELIQEASQETDRLGAGTHQNAESLGTNISFTSTDDEQVGHVLDTPTSTCPNGNVEAALTALDFKRSTNELCLDMCKKERQSFDQKAASAKESKDKSRDPAKYLEVLAALKEEACVPITCLLKCGKENRPKCVSEVDFDKFCRKELLPNLDKEAEDDAGISAIRGAVSGDTTNFNDSELKSKEQVTEWLKTLATCEPEVCSLSTVSKKSIGKKAVKDIDKKTRSRTVPLAELSPLVFLLIVSAGAFVSTVV